jgi:hypothetical protein
MNQNHEPTLRIHGPVDLVSAVPFLLGFHPIDSLVLIGLTHGVLVVTARLDLADAVAHDVLIAETLEAMLRGGSTQFLAAIFSGDAPATEQGTPHADLALTVAALIDEAGGELLDALLVSNGAWSSYLCADPRCCPPSGRMLPDTPTPFAAAATVAGLTVAPSRHDLERRFEPDRDRRLPRELVEHEGRGLGPVIDRAHTRRSRTARLVTGPDVSGIAQRNPVAVAVHAAAEDMPARCPVTYEGYTAGRVETLIVTGFGVQTVPM